MKARRRAGSCHTDSILLTQNQEIWKLKIDLNEKWTIKTAKELYTYTSGISKGSQFFGTGYPYLTFTEIFHNYFVPEVLTSLVQSNERERENCSIKRGDVFLTRTSETDDELGMSCVALKDYPNATFNGFTKRLRPLTDEVVPEYAGFYFRSPIFRAAVTSMSSIITRASLNEKMLDKLPICYPSKPTQQKIASILSAYDNLIQNYKKQIEALQTAASELYKEWFVRFRLPGYQTAEFENGIPKGWKVEKIGEYCNIRIGGDVPEENSEIKDEKHKYPIFSNGINEDGLYGFTDTFKISEPSVTISARGTVGFVCLRREPYYPIVRLICLIPRKDLGVFYLYHSLKYVDLDGNGTSQQQLTAPMVSKRKIVIAEEKIIEKFNLNAKIIYNKIDLLKIQITNLTQQRNLLLPRLMSGKLEVE